MILGCVPLSWLLEVLIISVLYNGPSESFHDHLPKEKECEKRLTSGSTECNSVSTCLFAHCGWGVPRNLPLLREGSTGPLRHIPDMHGKTLTHPGPPLTPRPANAIWAPIAQSMS